MRMPLILLWITFCFSILIFQKIKNKTALVLIVLVMKQRARLQLFFPNLWERPGYISFS